MPVMQLANYFGPVRSNARERVSGEWQQERVGESAGNEIHILQSHPERTISPDLHVGQASGLKFYPWHGTGHASLQQPRRCLAAVRH